MSPRGIEVRLSWYKDLLDRNISFKKMKMPDVLQGILQRIHESDPHYSLKCLKSWLRDQQDKREGRPPRRHRPKQSSALAAPMPSTPTETPSAMAFVLEAMRVSNTFLLNLPPDEDGALDNLASVCGVDVASLKTYHSSLHSRSSRPEVESLPPLIIPQTTESNEPQTPSTAVTSPSPFTAAAPLQFKHFEPATLPKLIKQEFIQEPIDIVVPSTTPTDTHTISFPHRASSSAVVTAVEQEGHRWSEFGDDLEYPSSEVDPEEIKMEEEDEEEEEEDALISPSAPEPTTLSQFLERIGDHESMFDYILELMDYGKHGLQPAV